MPSRTSDYVMVFSDITEGAHFGYAQHDGVTDAGEGFDYTGAGQVGDQEFLRGNRTLVNHAEENKRLQLFVAAGTLPGSGRKQQEYVGEYRVRQDDRGPFHYARAVDSRGQDRTVIVFHLERLSSGTAPVRVPRSQPATEPKAPFQVPLEVDRTYVSARRASEAATTRRREAELTSMFNSWLAMQGRSANRWAIPIDSGAALLTDYYTDDDNTLFEAKASSSRNDVRMAIGQLHDYRHNLGVVSLRCALLLPDEPAPDLVDMLRSIGFGCVVRAGTGFRWLIEAS